MPTPDRAPRFSEAPGTYVVVGVLLVITVVALLAVPTYAHLTPTLGGIPFFYWYTLLWLVINAVLQFAAYRLIRRVTRRPSSTGTEAAR
jgi:uncharacterized membrane protein